MKYNVIHVSQSGRKTIIRKAVSIQEANECFYGIDNTYIEECTEVEKGWRMKNYKEMTDEQLEDEFLKEVFDSSILWNREDAEPGSYIIRDGEIVFLYELIQEEMQAREMAAESQGE